MENLNKSKITGGSLFLELFAIVLVLFIFLLIIGRYNPTLTNSTDYFFNRNLKLAIFENHYIESKLNYYADKYPTINYITWPAYKYFPFNKAYKYAYLNYPKIFQEYKTLNISESNSNGSITNSIPVLVYHGTIAEDPKDPYTIKIEDFKNHMFALKKAGYRTIDTEDLYKFMRGEKKLTDKDFLLTFDDGLKETYYNADPILKLLDYKAVMFIIVDPSLNKNSRYYLNKNELWIMEKSGRWDLQSHSYNAHYKIKIDKDGNLGPFYSNKMWIENRLETDEEYKRRIENDLKLSRNYLEKEFDNKIIGFALPFGDFGQRETNYPESEKILINATREFFNLVFYQFKPAVNKDFRGNYNNEKNDFYLIMRISADSIKSTRRLLEEIDSAKSINLPYEEKFNNRKKWVNLWGNVEFLNNKLIITNPPLTPGAMSYLDGSFMLKDYMYSVILEETTAKKAILLARFADSRNYIGCKYENNNVGIINQKNGYKTDIREARVELYNLKNVKLKICVKNNLVSCSLNDKEILSATILDMPKNGGVGFRVENLADLDKSIISNIKIGDLE